MEVKRPMTIVDSKAVTWMEISPRSSDFSIEYILSAKGPGGQQANAPDVCERHRQTQFDWLQCTRYRPPKLQRTRRKEGRQRRKPGRNPRIPFSGTQVAVLEDRFRLGHYLSSCEVERLSTLLCLSETRVKIWFQNRRARERRERETSGKRTNSEANHSEDMLSRSMSVENPETLSSPSSPVDCEASTPKKTQLSLLSSIRSAFSPCYRPPLMAKSADSTTVRHRS